MKNFISKFTLFTLVLFALSCSEDEPGKETKPDEPEVNFKPSNISFNTAGMIRREAPKDSFQYADNNEVENYYQFRLNGSIRQYHYLEESSGKILVYRNNDTDPEYVINAPEGNIKKIDLTKYESDTGTPGMIKYVTEGNVIIITRYEYPSLEKPDYDIEVDGDIIKRTIITLNSAGNVSKIEVLTWDYTHKYLEKVITLRDLVYDSNKNPLKGLRKEYEFYEQGFYYNHELIEYLSSNNVISYSADYYDDVTQEVEGTNNYAISYQLDDKARIISSKGSTGQGEYADDIKTITY